MSNNIIKINKKIGFITSEPEFGYIFSEISIIIEILNSTIDNMDWCPEVHTSLRIFCVVFNYNLPTNISV